MRVIALLGLCYLLASPSAADEIDTARISNGKQGFNIKLVPAERRYEIDIGVVLAARAYVVNVRLENGMLEDLAPVETRSSCSCVIPNLSKKPIKSGDTTALEIKVKAPAKPGAIGQSIDLICSCGDSTRVITLFVRGQAKTAVSLDCQSVVLGKGMAETEFRLKVKTNFKAVNIEKVVAKASSKQIRIEAARVEDGELVLNCVGIANQQGLTGESTAVLLFETTDTDIKWGPETHEISFVSDTGWRLRPTQISFRRLDSQDKLQASVILLAPKTQKAKSEVKSAVLNIAGDRIDCDLIEQSERPFGILLTLEVPASLSTKLRDGKSLAIFQIGSDEVQASVQFFE